MILEDEDNKDFDVIEDIDMTPTELYAELLLREELIITVENHLVAEIKASLINVKAKENTKLKDKGMPVDKSKLVVNVVTDKELKEGFTKLHISLVKRRSFNILKIETPQDL